MHKKEYWYLEDSEFETRFLGRLQEALTAQAAYYSKSITIDEWILKKVPSRCRCLEIPTGFTFKTVKDVDDNYHLLNDVVEEYNLIDRMTEILLTDKRIKDRTCVRIAFVATNYGPSNKTSALLFCWKRKGWAK